MGYAKGGEVDYGKARRRLESLGLSTDAGDRNVIIDEVRDGFGIDCSEVIRASSDDDVYVAVDGLLQDYGAYAQQDEEYAKGGKTKKKMWLAKERGGEEFVLEAPNKKEAEEDALITSLQSIPNPSRTSSIITFLSPASVERPKLSNLLLAFP